LWKKIFELIALVQVEVRSVACADSKVQKVLQEIIQVWINQSIIQSINFFILNVFCAFMWLTLQETTNKLNQIVKHEASAEIQLREISTSIEVETQRGQLLEVQKAHSQTEAEMTGLAEAQRVRVSCICM
jgi:hypothetical protein